MEWKSIRVITRGCSEVCHHLLHSGSANVLALQGVICGFIARTNDKNRDVIWFALWARQIEGVSGNASGTSVLLLVGLCKAAFLQPNDTMPTKSVQRSLKP
jgi:hypothetical protein